VDVNGCLSPDEHGHMGSLYQAGGDTPVQCSVVQCRAVRPRSVPPPVTGEEANATKETQKYRPVPPVTFMVSSYVSPQEGPMICVKITIIAFVLNLQDTGHRIQVTGYR
jgi:hypothetical protein